jgi:Phytanoyl-CoA dioxygenase (PhyH)
VFSTASSGPPVRAQPSSPGHLAICQDTPLDRVNRPGFRNPHSVRRPRRSGAGCHSRRPISLDRERPDSQSHAGTISHAKSAIGVWFRLLHGPAGITACIHRGLDAAGAAVPAVEGWMGGTATVTPIALVPAAASQVLCAGPSAGRATWRRTPGRIRAAPCPTRCDAARRQAGPFAPRRNRASERRSAPAASAGAARTTAWLRPPGIASGLLPGPSHAPWRSLSAMWCISAFTPDDGPLRVIPGSHRVAREPGRRAAPRLRNGPASGRGQGRGARWVCHLV